MNIVPYKCPKCTYVWLYKGNSTMRVGCPKCSHILLGQKVGLAELTVEEYAEAKGMALLKKFEDGLQDLEQEIDILEALNGKVKESGSS